MAARLMGYVSASNIPTIVGAFPYGVATGGASSASVTVGGISYTLLTFTASGVLTVTTAGLFDVALFAGGAGAAGSVGGVTLGGGGGAGGVSINTVYLDANTTIQVGAGGAEAAMGSSSCIDNTAFAMSVAGGGTSGGSTYNLFLTPEAGGSGGGGGTDDNAVPLAARTKHITGAVSMAPSISGFAGGDGSGGVTSSGAGGGGGATGVGGNRAGATGGAGGTGYDTDNFTGEGSLFKAGGGGGGGISTGGAGGSGVGGAGGSNSAGNAASANTASGGGGGGVSGTSAGAAGGSGIVYIRFKV